MNSMASLAPWRLCVRLVLVLVVTISNQSYLVFGEPSLSALIDCTGHTAATTVAESGDASGSLRRACEYLWSQQAADGGWHSGQYALLRSGQALTPFVLYTLLQVPEVMCTRPAGGVERALEFIRKHVDEHGALGHADPVIAEYPVYSTAYALKCLGLAGTEEDAALRARMIAFLRSAQLNEANGFARTSPCFGGWGFEKPLKPGQPGHMDLAHTRRVLDALSDCPPCLEGIGAVRNDAQLFLHVVQKHPDAANRQPFIEGFSPATGPVPYDGGFYFSPVVLAANKGREEFQDAKYFRSYATATCDGILALLAAGVPRDDERVVRAIEWLKAHDDLTYPQGVPTDHPEPWGDAIHNYHLAVGAEAYRALRWQGDWKDKLAREVSKDQAADGCFRNSASPLMKEDDPLLCTALAVTALSHCAVTQ
jgi:squalene-hopene/tetraprenyl-beta-curcumene cyclase